MADIRALALVILVFASGAACAQESGSAADGRAADGPAADSPKPADAISVAANAAAPLSGDMSGDVIAAKPRVAPQSMAEVQLSFAPIVNDVAPAVVNIYTRRVAQARGLRRDSLFERFFGEMTPREQSSLGSGVIVSPDGVIVTNNHVVEKMTEIKVVFADRREFNAETIFTDPQTDLAVLRIETDEPLPFLQFADSDAIEVGDVVLALGNPFGVGQTVTSGIVSALARTAVSISDYQFFIQTDAAINPGNSGGALVDVDGKLVGINTAIYSRSGGSNGIGFAIPARLVQQVLATAVNGGVLTRPWIGAATDTVTADMARALRLDRPAGALIEDVWKGGPADKAGLKPGDVVVAFDGQPVFDAETLRYRVGVQSEDAVADIIFKRNGKERAEKITLRLPPEAPAPDARRLSGNHPLNAVTIANMSPRFNEELGLNQLLSGVVVTEVDRRASFAGRRGLRRGHRILSVNGRRIDTARDLEREMARRATEWEIEVDVGSRVVPWRVGR
ncbi:MAG: Do family serine endopeptidase [Pseudomonadota bacterium]